MRILFLFCVKKRKDDDSNVLFIRVLVYCCTDIVFGYLSGIPIILFFDTSIGNMHIILCYYQWNQAIVLNFLDL